ncbi:MAG: InlB B-repeat-containing protein, partial [Bacilli bacterium]|nr:InlB B-repeat-containing protein [Bacilli bacterium]
MRKFKLFVGLCVFMALSLFITGIYGYFKMTTSPVVNTLSIKDKTTYTVVHKTMDLNGTTYTDYFTENYEVSLGTTVTPATLTTSQLPGFTAPATQTVTLNSFQNTVITYLYTRKQYDLTITNSQYVDDTTSTPAGRYYYGTTIHLEADTDDGYGNNFIKWSNNNTNRIYEFTLEGDTTIGPIYTDTYQVTYVLNNGDPNETRLVDNGDPINYLPNITYNDCTGSSGDRIADGCTYDYELVGWYTESTFENQVNEQYAPDHDVTLYAKWNKVFFYQEDSEVFNADHLIDSDIALFSAFNSGKDFIVEFRIDSFANDNVDRAVLFADMEETADPYPGVQFRWFQNSFNVNANVNDKNHKKNDPVTVSVGNKIIMKRENGLFSYSLDNGVTFVNYQDFSNFNKFFDITATFGGQDAKPERKLKGALSEMHVELIDRPAYTIKFHANGGTGMMLDQVVEVGKTVNLNDKEYEKDPVHYTFAGWNTEPD